MNLYTYLKSSMGLDDSHAIGQARVAYERFKANGMKVCDPFWFMLDDNGYQSFMFGKNQIVEVKNEVAIVTGWAITSSGWKVEVKTAKGVFVYSASELKPAEYPEGLVEIIRGDVQSKIDEAFTKR